MPETGNIRSLSPSSIKDFALKSFSHKTVSSLTPYSWAIEETVSPAFTSYSITSSLGLSEIMVTGVIVVVITPVSTLSVAAPATSGFAGTPGYEPETTEDDSRTPPPAKTTNASPKIEPCTKSEVFAPRLTIKMSTTKFLAFSNESPVLWSRKVKYEASAFTKETNSL